MDIQEAPEHLSEEAKSLWQAILEEFDLSASEKAILKVGLEAYDRCQACRQKITEEGFTIKDPSGRVRAHPALQAEKQAASVYLQSFRLLGLEDEKPAEVGRPGRFI
jgi:P27 family predicted phage terminase small subunit